MAITVTNNRTGVSVGEDGSINAKVGDSFTVYNDYAEDLFYGSVFNANSFVGGVIYSDWATNHDYIVGTDSDGGNRYRNFNFKKASTGANGATNGAWYLGHIVRYGFAAGSYDPNGTAFVYEWGVPAFVWDSNAAYNQPGVLNDGYIFLTGFGYGNDGDVSNLSVTFNCSGGFFSTSNGGVSVGTSVVVAIMDGGRASIYWHCDTPGVYSYSAQPSHAQRNDGVVTSGPVYSRNVSVYQKNRAPSAASFVLHDPANAGTDHSNEGSTVTVNATITDPDGTNAFNFTWYAGTSSGPSGGGSFNSSTGNPNVFSPGLGNTASYANPLVLVADYGNTWDSRALATTFGFLIPINRKPVISVAIDSTQIVEGQTYHFTASYANVNNYAAAAAQGYAWASNNTWGNLGSQGWTFSGGTLNAGGALAVATWTAPAAGGAVISVVYQAVNVGGAISNVTLNYTVRPHITLNVSPASATQYDGSPLALSANTTNSLAAIVYTWTCAQGGTFSGSGQTVTFTPPNRSVAVYTVQCQVNDGFSSATTASMTLTVANRPPTGTIAHNASNGYVSETGSCLFTVSAIDPDGDTLSYAWSVVSGGGTLTANTASATYAPGAINAAASVTVSCLVSDPRGGSVTLNSTLNINHQPLASLSGLSARVAPSQTVSVSAAITDPDILNPTLTWVVTGGALLAGQGTGNATVQAASSQFATVTVGFTYLDGLGGSVTASLTSVTDRAPLVSLSPTAVVAKPSISYTFTASASDPDGDVLSYAWTCDYGTILSGQGSSVISWQSPADSASQPSGRVTCVVSDSFGLSATASAVIGPMLKHLSAQGGALVMGFADDDVESGPSGDIDRRSYGGLSLKVGPRGELRKII